MFQGSKHLVYSKVVTKLTDIISNSQFGFLQNRSTLQQLLHFTNEPIIICELQMVTIKQKLNLFILYQITIQTTHVLCIFSAHVQDANQNQHLIILMI